MFSQLYPGSQHGNPVYIPILQRLATFTGFTPEQRQRTIIRNDSGLGCDYNVEYALDEGWQVLGKGYGGRRSPALARKVPEGDWMPIPGERWVTPVIAGPRFVRPVQHLLLRWKTEGGDIKHSLVVCSVLDWSMEQVIAHYDERGCCETEIQRDKGGLKMEKRRKMHLAAQEALILLTDLAHNTTAWSCNWMFPEGPLAGLGTTRLVEDVFRIPGRLIFQHDRLTEVVLKQSHPLAEPVKAGLERLLAHFGYP